MNAYKCDRCGKFFEPIKITSLRSGRFVINSCNLSTDKIGYAERVVEVCPECRDDFKKWFEDGTPKEENK